MGLQFEDDEDEEEVPKPLKKKKETKEPARMRVIPKRETVVKEVSLFFEGELRSIAKACHDYQRSHTRAKNGDPLTSLEAKCYQDAGKILGKIKKFLEGG